MAKAKKNAYYIELIGKTLDVLEAFVQIPERQLTLSDISQQLKMNKNSIFRILYSLSEHGYVIKHNQKYELGPKLIDLSNARMRNTDLLTIATPYLQRVRDDFGETVNLGILDEDQIRYIGVWESHDRLRLAEKVGAVDMLHASALGKVYLAHLPAEESRLLLGAKKLPSLTKNTITSLATLRREMETIRERGYAIDAEESTLGARCVARVIFNPEGTRPLAAVSVSGPTVRMTPDRVAEIGSALKSVTTEIRKMLGGVTR